MGTIYRNPALAELVAEFRWQLTALSMPPGAAVDPFFNATLSALTTRLAAQGFGSVQALVPPQVPLEFLSGNATHRFTKPGQQWPVVQAGPGIFSVNIGGAAYTGWIDFRKVIHQAYADLMQSFPSAEQLFKPRSVALRYIDQFGASHGLLSYAQFTTEKLMLKSVFNETFISGLGIDTSTVSTSSQTVLALKSLPESRVQIQVQESIVNNQPTCVVQFILEKMPSSFMQKDVLEAWLDQAHDEANKMFEAMVSPELRRFMNPTSAAS